LSLRDHIRTIPDFPIPGIMFRDITPLLGDADALAESIEAMSSRWRDARVDLVDHDLTRGRCRVQPLVRHRGGIDRGHS